LSGNFSIQNHLKDGDALSPVLYKFSLEYVISKVQENQMGLKGNRTHQRFAYGDDVNLLGDDRHCKAGPRDFKEAGLQTD
jgi:hypothetical protein